MSLSIMAIGTPGEKDIHCAKSSIQSIPTKLRGSEALGESSGLPNDPSTPAFGFWLLVCSNHLPISLL